MSARTAAHGARFEEQAELAALRDQAARTRLEAAATINALLAKAARAERRWGRRAALIGLPAGLAIAAAVVLYRYRA